MSYCLFGSHSVGRVLDQQLAYEVHHFVKCVALAIVRQSLHEIAVHNDFIIRCEQLLACAQ